MIGPLNLGEVITRFAHNIQTQQEIPNCDTKDCYNLTLAYNNTINQMKQVIENSDSCHQSFQVRFPFSVLISKSVGPIIYFFDGISPS